MSARLYSRVITRCIDCPNASHRAHWKGRGTTWGCTFDERFEIDTTEPIPARCPLPKCSEDGEPIDICA